MSQSIGVIIARLHVSKPHKGHFGFVDYVKGRHASVLLVLGVPATYPTDWNPLPFELRRAMLQSIYPDLTIVPLQDNRSDEAWSNSVDELIKTSFPGKRAILYGSRDSFMSHYSGEFETAYVQEVGRHNGTAERERIARTPRNTKAFREGVIYATLTRPPITYPTVDVGIYRRNSGEKRPALEVLLGRKLYDPEGKYRFIGGFVDPTDPSYEAAGKREKKEESGKYEIGPLEYVCSHRVDDWRYRRTKDSIMTILFRAQYLFGYFEPKDDISELKWFDAELLMDTLVPEHLPLGEKFLNSFNQTA